MKLKEFLDKNDIKTTITIYDNEVFYEAEIALEYTKICPFLNFEVLDYTKGVLGYHIKLDFSLEEYSKMLQKECKSILTVISNLEELTSTDLIKAIQNLETLKDKLQTLEVSRYGSVK